MTKAEERRLYLQGQTSTTPTATTSTTSATPALSKAEQRRQQLQQAAQPTVVEQPTVTQAVQPVTQPTPQPVTQTVVQPTQTAKEMKKDNFNDFKKVFAEYMTKNKTASVDDMIKLAKDKGLYSGETQYQLDKMKASQKPNTALATTKLAPQTIPNYQNINEMNLKKAVENSPENKFDKNYGEKEAKEEFKQLDFNKSNNAEKYTEYKTELAKAEAENNTRNIAKYSNLLEDYKEAYKEKNEGKDKKYDIVQLESELKKDTDYMNSLLDRYATTQDLNEKQQIASDYKRAEEAKKTRLAEYQDALAYDEIVNKNLARDIVSSFGTNVLGGTANIINSGYSLVQRGSGQDLSTINPKDLYDFVQGKNNLFTGNALLSLATSSLLDKNNKRLSTLLEQIYNRTYQGTQDDLAKELDEIQKEKYQAFKDKYTQDELDAVANQLRHNAAYGSAAFIPNAFGTVGNMVPSILAGVATGGAAEQLGGGAMATAGTVANRAQQVGSMGTLGAGAFSGGLDQALQEGANYNQAFNYGVLSGATEVGTEMLGGEAVNKFLGQQGKTALGKVFGKAIDNLNIESKVGRIIANTISDVAGESTEEMISEAINPLWRAITYDKDALPQNREEMQKYIKDIINAGIEAIPSTLIMQGAGIGSNVVKTQQIENGIINSIQDSDLSQIVKNQLIDEVRKASTDVKLGLEESDIMTDKAWEKYANLSAQSEQMKAKLPEGYTLPQSTIDTLAYTQNSRPGLTINFDNTIQGNGTFVENPDGTRTITLNPNSKRAVEFTLTHELGHDLQGTQEYTQLQNLLEDYAKGKPKYTESLRALEKTYRDSGANFNLKDEATNDMLGQAIGEQEFYNKLAENPTLFERVTNGLKNLLGNKETKLKNKIEKLTRNAYQSAYKGAGSNQVQNSLSNTVDNQVRSSLSEEPNTDNQGRELSPMQKVRFKDSKVRDDNGNLERVYHTTTNEGEQFNIFNPVGTPGYRFGDNVVNYYTNSQKMSSSYAHGEYKNADTSKAQKSNTDKALEIAQNRFGQNDMVFEPEKFTNKFGSTFEVINQYKKQKDGKKEFITSYPLNTLLSDEELKKNKYQYSGYLNIKNPYIVDAKGEQWNRIKDGLTPVGERLKAEYNILKDNDLLYRTKRIYDNADFEAKEKWAEFQKRLYDLDWYQQRIAWEYAREGNLDNLYQHNFALDATEKNIMGRHINDVVDGKTLEEIGLLAYDGKRDKIFEREMKKIKEEYPDIDFISTNDLTNLATMYMGGLEEIEHNYAKETSTNDIVKKVLEMNKQGQNYDGVIIQNVVDYGGKSDTYEPANVYVTFNSNQFKNIDNTNPTDNPDIRYQKSTASWQDFLDQNLNLAQGTKTNFERLPTNEELQEQETKSIAEEPINKITVDRPLEEMRSFKKVGDRKVNAYQYENPEVKPFFQFEAKLLLDDLNNSIKGEKWMNEDNEWGGTKRDVVQDIADLLDGEYGVKLKYDEIRNGLEAIIKDEGSENIASAKRIEMVLDKRLREGYTDSQGYEHDPSDNYKKFLNGEEYVAPEEYLNQQMYERYGNPEDTTSYSLSEKEQKEVNDYTDKLFEDKTLDERFVTQTYEKIRRIKNYSDFEEIKQEVSDYKDKMYGGISGLEDSGKKTRKYVETIKNSPFTPKEVKSKLTKDVRKYYTPQSNEKTLQNAKDIIGNDYESAEREFLKNNIKNAEQSAIGDLLIMEAYKNGDYRKAADLSIALSEKLTDAGQFIQAASIIKRLSPEGMLMYGEKQLRKAVEDIKRNNGNVYNKLVKEGIIKEKNGVGRIEFTEEETKQILDNMEKASKMKDGREKDILVGQTLKIMANKIPATTLEKIAALRRNGLLFNLRTLNRNLGSNATFGGLEILKDIPATAIDKAVSLITGKRTKTLPSITAYAKGFKQGAKYSIQDLYYGIDTSDGSGGKYQLPGKVFKRTSSYRDILDAYKSGQIKEGTKELFGRMLSDYEDVAGFFVNGTDRPFWQGRFESELKSQMKLNNLEYGKDIPTQDMLDIATEAADYATFKNKNKLSESLNELRRTLNNGKPLGLADALGLTFTNVPGSVGSKIYDYTVGGYIKAIKEIYDATVKGNEFNQRKFVDYLSRSITGTGGIAFLIPLIAKGILTGNYDDDKDKADLEREMGMQENAVNLSALKRYIKGEDTEPQKGDKYYTIDWLQPISALAMTGTNLYNMASKGNAEEDTASMPAESEYWVRKTDKVSAGDLALEGLKTTADQVVDMSSLGNLQQLFKGYGGLGENLTDVPASFVSSFIPTISNNIGQLTDENARITKDNTSKFNTSVNKVINKIPGLRKTLEKKYTTLGEEKKQYKNGNDFLSTFVNPGYLTTYSPTDIQNELMNVYEQTGDNSIFPTVSPSSITYGNESYKLKPEGTSTYQKASGQYASGIYDALLDNDFYKSLEADQKAKVLKKISEDARDTGKAAIGINTKNYDELEYDIEKLEENGIPLADYYLAINAKNNMAKNKTYTSKKKAIRENTDLTEKQEEVLFRLFSLN